MYPSTDVGAVGSVETAVQKYTMARQPVQNRQQSSLEVNVLAVHEKLELQQEQAPAQHPQSKDTAPRLAEAQSQQSSSRQIHNSQSSMKAKQERAMSDNRVKLHPASDVVTRRKPTAAGTMLVYSHFMS